MRNTGTLVIARIVQGLDYLQSCLIITPVDYASFFVLRDAPTLLAMRNYMWKSVGATIGLGFAQSQIDAPTGLSYVYSVTRKRKPIHNPCGAVNNLGTVADAASYSLLLVSFFHFLLTRAHIRCSLLGTEKKVPSHQIGSTRFSVHVTSYAHAILQLFSCYFSGCCLCSLHNLVI